MVIPRKKHKHVTRVRKKRIRKQGRLWFKSFWVVDCLKQPCALRHIFNDEKTARFAADWIESSQASKMTLLDSGS